MYRPPGSLGLPCTKDTDCTAGVMPSCWEQEVLDEPGNVPTPNGYCTSSCTTNSDCGSEGTCATVSGSMQYCLESCTNATTCRDPSYACWVLSNTSGYCWPSTLLTCNPTVGTGQCMLDNNGVPAAGGCIRRTFEDLGQCQQTCALGPGTCPVLGNGDKQHCIYVNATLDTNGVPTRDKYKGTACFELYANAITENGACSYLDECQDGLECNLTPGGDSKCHTLCLVGLAGACAAPLSCKDVFKAGAGGAGLCL
jgi:hypothetical protein